MKNEKLCAALVGCGTIAPVHLAALTKLGVAEIVALCDVKAERAEEKKEKFAPEARVFTDFEQMLSELPEIDVVHICTPHYLHTPMAVYALERGKHVFLEKPVGISEENIAVLREAEKKAAGKLCVCFQNRLNDTTVAIDRLAEKYGAPKGCRAFVNWTRDEAYYTESGWRGAYATEGGGVMINQAIHTLDLMLRYMGKPTKLSATTANHHLKGTIEVEDTCEIYLEFVGGGIGNFYATTSYVANASIILELCFEGHTVSLLGGKVYDNGEPVALMTNAAATVGKSYWGKGHEGLIALFYEAIEKELPVPVTLDSGSLSLSVLLAAYRSHGEAVML